MKGDFTRSTFQPEKHYSGVRMQQGRVQLDADWNENLDILRHRIETETIDVIGECGVPADNAGFGVVVDPESTSLSPTEKKWLEDHKGDFYLTQGRAYVDGILVENDQTVPFSEQPFVLPHKENPLKDKEGIYLLYLDVWERHITALEDPSIREVALGGPDTATRTQVIWQVDTHKIEHVVKPITCADKIPGWAPPASDGTLRARARPDDSADSPCVVPAKAGYRRLENQLYRVEIHDGSDTGKVTYKWSRDNGSVVVAVSEFVADSGGTKTRVASLGRDDVLGLHENDWIEVTDDTTELAGKPGTMARITEISPDNVLTLSVPIPAYKIEDHPNPKARRWDSDGPQDVVVTGADNYLPLEDGVEIQFGGGSYHTGDYWLIPARSVDDSDPHPPLCRPAFGIRHHYCKLAIIEVNAAGVIKVIDDCRKKFPPLTDLPSGDCCCTVSVGECGEYATIESALERLKDVQDALICLCAGTYTLEATLNIGNPHNPGHLQILGIGPGTRIIAPTSETGLVFDGCASVKISNLYVETGLVGSKRGSSTEHLNGTLTFLNCASVTVENVNLRCAGGPSRAAACITVKNDKELAHNTQASIRNCNLEVGHLQVGILLVNVERIRVTDNLIRAGARPPNRVLLENAGYRSLLRRHLISNISTSVGDTIVDINDRTMRFDSHPDLKGKWIGFLPRPPLEINTPQKIKRFLLQFSNNLIHNWNPRDLSILHQTIGVIIREDTPTANQGIVVGGMYPSDIHITKNTIQDVMQGIHLGLSERRNTFSIGCVVLRDNIIHVSLPTSATRERHGIFIGSCNSMVIEDNYITLKRVSSTEKLPIDGIRLFGVMGRRMIVRHNHLGPKFSIGIKFAPLNRPLPEVKLPPLWIITENEVESPNSEVVDVDTLVRALVRGIDDNFS